MRRSADVPMMLRRAVWAAATLTVIAVACGGCAYVMPTTALEPQSTARWVAKDVPVPEGFVLDATQSKMRERGTRTYFLVYKRKDYIDMDRACDFWKQACEGQGWQLHFLYGFDKRGMIFFSDKEELRVTVERSLASAVVWATIELEPGEHAEGALK